MKRSNIIAAIIVALLSNQASAKTPKNPLTGTWLIAGIEQQGHAVPEKELPLEVLRYEDNSITLVVDSEFFHRMNEAREIVANELCQYLIVHG